VDSNVDCNMRVTAELSLIDRGAAVCPSIPRTCYATPRTCMATASRFRRSLRFIGHALCSDGNHNCLCRHQEEKPPSASEKLLPFEGLPQLMWVQ
jgi:hypothetical protein